MDHLLFLHKIQNIRTAGTYIEKIKAENPDFVILPEMFCCPYQTENFPVYAEKEGGPSWQAMSDYARKVSSQCAGPVVILNAAGTKIILAPSSAIVRTNSGKRMS